MKKPKPSITFSIILIIYAFMYMATSKPCDEECEKYELASTFFNEKHYVSYSFHQYRTTDSSMYILGVDTSFHKEWPLVADSACSFLKDIKLVSRKVAIINRNDQLDTLAKLTCF